MPEGCVFQCIQTALKSLKNGALWKAKKKSGIRLKVLGKSVGGQNAKVLSYEVKW